MRQYSIRMDIARRRLRRLMVLQGGILLLSGLVVEALLTTMSARAFGGLPVHIWFLLMLLLFGAIMIRRGLVSGRRELESYRLWLGEGELRRVASTLPEVTLARDEVSRLKVGPYGLLVEGAGGAIAIPSSLEGFEEVKALLTEWRAPEPLSERVEWMRPLVGAAGGLGVLGAWQSSLHLDGVPVRLVSGAVLYAAYRAAKRYRYLTGERRVLIVLALLYFGGGPLVRLYQEEVAPVLLKSLMDRPAAAF